MTPNPDSFSPPDLPLSLDPALADEDIETERLSLGERLVVSVSAFFSTLADRSHIADSPAFFETGQLSAHCASFRRDAR
jgi:hypothetical protein